MPDLRQHEFDAGFLKVERGAVFWKTKHDAGVVTLDVESISAINVQTDLVERRPVRRTLHLAGEITGNSKTAAWFKFTVYERDLPWLKTGETLEVIVASSPRENLRGANQGARDGGSVCGRYGF